MVCSGKNKFELRKNCKIISSVARTYNDNSINNTHQYRIVVAMAMAMMAIAGSLHNMLEMDDGCLIFREVMLM